MRKLFLLSTFFIAAPVVFFFTLFFYLYVAVQSSPGASMGFLFKPTHTVAYAALPTTQGDFSDAVVPEDARTELIRQFLAQYHSPLEPYADLIVKSAEEHDLDYRLVPAIAMQESNLCRRIPEGSHNCWGFGIYGAKITTFDSYPAAIEQVTKTLAQKYKKDHGLVTANEIMSMYTPSSNGSWANGVNYFMDRME